MFVRCKNKFLWRSIFCLDLDVVLKNDANLLIFKVREDYPDFEVVSLPS